MAQTRALAGIRLSSMTDTTTSPERQRETLDRLAVYRQFEIVGHAEDLDVSAVKFRPIDRPQLGDWMKNRTSEFDVMIFWKLDRVVRSPADLTDMIRWCKEHGKGLIFADDNFDLSTAMGEAMAYIAAVFAGMEVQRTKERLLQARAHVRKLPDRFHGGNAPYGYSIVAGEAGRTLAVDPATSRVVREMYRLVTEGGWSGQQIAGWLNETGVPTNADRLRAAANKKPRGTRWTQVQVRNVLRSEALRGHKLHNGRPLRGADGLPMQIAEPVLSDTEWKTLQQTLDGKVRPKTRKHGGTPLLGVVECADCGKHVYRSVFKAGQPAYKCNTPGCKTYLTEELVNDWAEYLFLDAVGATEVHRKEFEPGEDHSDALEQTRESISDLRDARYKRREFTTPEDLAVYDSMMAELLAARSELEKAPSRSAGWRMIPTGVTYREKWELAGDAPSDLDTWTQRGELMRNAGLRMALAGTSRAPRVQLYSVDTEETVRAAERR